jgi:lipopolysaccharide export LptBFGC system permease protein LptF
MKLIDRFVSRELLVNVLFAIVVLSLVLVVGNIFRKLLPLLVNHDVPMEYLLTFIAYVLPLSLIFTIPWDYSPPSSSSSAGCRRTMNLWPCAQTA